MPKDATRWLSNVLDSLSTTKSIKSGPRQEQSEPQNKCAKIAVEVLVLSGIIGDREEETKVNNSSCKIVRLD
jgi:hypothetical protein